ncbi:MAG: EboA domain-containing protein [Candidatus Methylomirabilia bacterium]
MTLAPAPFVLLFRDLLHRRAVPPGREWFERVAAAAGPSFDRGAFIQSFTAVARRLGKAPLGLAREEISRLRAHGIDWPMDRWGLDELGRATLLLVVAVHLRDAALEELVEECYRQGDNRERQAVLRALPLLPAADRLLPLGVDACRTHIQPLFEAIACENPYPTAHFPELNFNQMVLKALFTGVALERIVGLEGRVTPELTRMAKDYVSERRAAGRSVPPDIWHLIGAKRSEL